MTGKRLDDKDFAAAAGGKAEGLRIRAEEWLRAYADFPGIPPSAAVTIRDLAAALAEAEAARQEPVAWRPRGSSAYQWVVGQPTEVDLSIYSSEGIEYAAPVPEDAPPKETP